MDHLTVVRRADDAPKAAESAPSFAQESTSAVETLDRCRILLELEYDRSTRSVRDRLINSLTQVRNALDEIARITGKS